MKRIFAFLVFGWVVFAAYGQEKSASSAAKYPARPVRIILGSGTGGGADIISRAVAQRLTDRWGRSVIVDNRPGGGGVIALELLAQAAPDGYTLFGGASLIVTATPLGKVGFDTRKVFVPVVQMTSVSYIVAAPASLPAHSIRDFIAYAKAKPGVLSYGSPGVGSIAHLGTELMKQMSGGLDVVHVPFKGYNQAFIELIADRIQLLLSSGIGAAPHLKTGKVKAIGVTSLKRLLAFPEVPTLSESGLPGFQLDNMHGLYAPAGVPAHIVAMINRDVSDIMAMPDIKSRLAADGADVAPPNSPADFKATFIREVGRWERFVKTSGIRIAD